MPKMLPLNKKTLSGTLDLTEWKDGFWIWDSTVDRNLAMRAKTEQEALLEVIEFYQERYLELKEVNRDLQSKVDGIEDIIKGG
jgi:hypothetical protein